jgi:hypothetical protein
VLPGGSAPSSLPLPPRRGQASLQRFPNVVGEEPLREHFVRPNYNNANIIVANYSLKEGSSRKRDNVVDHASPPTAERTPRFRWGLRLRFRLPVALLFRVIFTGLRRGSEPAPPLAVTA